MTALALALLTALATAPAAAPPRARHAVDADSVDRVVRTLADSGFSGVVLVAVGDSVVLRRAYGRSTPRLTASSAFWIASVTKSFTAAAVLTLARDGRLALTDSLHRFFPDAPRDKRAITVRQLLTHTAGFGGTYAGSGVVERRAAVRAILAAPLAYAPGRAYRYGDDDYALLAAVIEVVTGRSWQDVVRERILAPAGLRETGFWCGPWRRTVPHPVPAADGPRSACGTARAPDWGHRGATGMSSTAADLLAWARVLQRGGDSGALAAIETPQVPVRREGALEVSYGYGARVYSRDGRVVEVVHSGTGDDGHTTMVRRLASGTTVVVLSNAGQHLGTTWSSYVATRLVPRDERP